MCSLRLSNLTGRAGLSSPFGFRSIRTRQIAILSVFTALYTVFRYIRTFPMYGLPGYSFRASDFLVPIYGVLLGPWLSIPCIVVGTVINYAIFPPTFFGLDFLPGLVAAIVASLLARGRHWAAVVLYTGLLASFLALPLSTFWITLPGGIAVPYAWLHMVALIFLVSPLAPRGRQWLEQSSSSALLIGMIVIVFSATMAQHLTGGILQELIRFPISGINTPKAASIYWSGIFVLYPIERIVITAVVSSLSAPLVRTLRSSRYLQALSELAGFSSRATAGS